jgi:hypothetical protein
MQHEKPSLLDLFENHRGKVSDKWSSYLPIYARSFERFRDRATRILEIGIQNGGSLEIYRKYFDQGSTIVGCDINPRCQKLKYPPDIHFVFGNCCEATTREKITLISPRFDIIIDDGSHRSSDIIQTFLMYFPLLEEGGAFIIEDLHASYWQDWEGGLFYTLSSMSFFKLLADVINAEHWGNGKTPEDLICNEFSEYQDLVHSAQLRNIFSVQFFNSICVVEKCSSANAPLLGRRVITGQQAEVESEVLTLNGSKPMRPDQSSNPFSVFV